MELKTTTPAPLSDETMVDTATAATIVGLAKNTLEKMRVYGGGPRFAKYRSAVRYSVRDLRQWIHLNSADSTSEHWRAAA